MQFHTLRIALKQSLALLSWAILRLVEANDGERIEQWEKTVAVLQNIVKAAKVYSNRQAIA